MNIHHIMKIKGYRIMRKFGGLAWVLMALFMVMGFQASDAAEQLIKEFVT